MSNIITGIDAIEYAEEHDITLNKYADPTEESRADLTVEQAREVASEDPSLIWVEPGITIEYLDKEQIWQDETTRYWFRVDGEEYCIADQNGEVSLLDSEGHPIAEANDHDGIKDRLMPHYQLRIDE